MAADVEADAHAVSQEQAQVKQEPADARDAGPPSTSYNAQHLTHGRRYSLAELTELGGGLAAREQLDALQARLRQGAAQFHLIPSICKPRSRLLPELEDLEAAGVRVPDWTSLRSTQGTRPANTAQQSAPPRNTSRTKASAAHSGAGRVCSAMKLLRAVKSKANGSGRTYTSKYRGVHQTFPTRRWEAQFRRNGKPTSLGCFDHEEEAARAYDKMMLWCEFHNAAGVKSGITNFDPTEYEKEYGWLQAISQDELIENLRSEGRRQAAHRMLRQKRESAGEPVTDDYEEPAPPQQPPQLQHQPQQPLAVGLPPLPPALLGQRAGSSSGGVGGVLPLTLGGHGGMVGTDTLLLPAPEPLHLQQALSDGQAAAGVGGGIGGGSEGALLGSL